MELRPTKTKKSSNPEMPQRNIDAHGSNLTINTGSIGDHSRSLHGRMLQFVAMELERFGAKHFAAKKGHCKLKATSRPPLSCIFMQVLQPLLGTAKACKAFELISGI